MKHPLSFLSNASYRTYNTNVARILGSVNAAILISDLQERYEYHADNDELTSHARHGQGWFYYTMDKAEERTCLSRKEQDRAIQILIKEGWIEKQVFGHDPKRYFRININKILEAFGLQIKSTELTVSDKSNCPKGTNRNVQKGQFLYMNHTKEPKLKKTTTSSTKVVEEEVSSKKQENNIEEYLAKISTFLERIAHDWGDTWFISVELLRKLIKKYGQYYLTDQVNDMIEKQKQALKDEMTSKKTKTKRIDNPANYLRKSCQENYAMSDLNNE